MYLAHCKHSPFLPVFSSQIQGYGFGVMPAMDSCNIVEFPVATMEFSLATFILQQIITTTLPTTTSPSITQFPVVAKKDIAKAPWKPLVQI
jgi:hypothetical protein